MKSNVIDAKKKFAERMVMVLRGRLTAANTDHAEAMSLVKQLKAVRAIILAEPVKRGR